MASGDMVGLSTAVVVDNVDPMDQGRVSVQYAGRSEAVWSDVVVQPGVTAGLIPIGSRVVLGFEDADGDRPFVLGAIQALGAIASVQPALSGLTTASGLSVALDDRTQALTLTTPEGLSVTLNDAAGAIQISDANGNLVALNGNGVAITAVSAVTVTAATLHIAAPTIQVDAGTAVFSGVVQCDTLIADSVVASTYTPGAGNVQ